MSHGLLFSGAYTWAHGTDNSNGAFSINGNPPIFVDAAGNPLLDQNEGNSDIDQRHAFAFDVLYELPIGRGRSIGENWSRSVNAVLGGWRVNSLILAGTGTPLDITIDGFGQILWGKLPRVRCGLLPLASNGLQQHQVHS